MRQRTFGVQGFWLDLGRQDQLDAAVVQHVHQPCEAARLRRQPGRHLRHPRQQHRVKLGRQFQVVILRARAAAQLLEVEPHHAAGTPPGPQFAVLDVQQRRFVARFGEAFERLAQGGFGKLVQRRVVQPHLRQRDLAIVASVVDTDHFELRLQQFDGRQDAVSVQAIRVQLVGPKVGGGDDGHAVRKQGRQQPVQDHRVGDVGHVKLVEANQPVAARDAPSEFVQRVHRALEVLQFAVHFAHELVKVQPCLARQRHGLKKAVHQEALAAPHAAPHVDAARNRRAHEQLGDRVAAARLVFDPLGLATLQRNDGPQLRRVRRVAPLGQGCQVELPHAHQVCAIRN